jgi:hypothetical protein
MRAVGRRAPRAPKTRTRGRTRIPKPYFLCLFGNDLRSGSTRKGTFNIAIPEIELKDNLFRVAGDGDTEDGTGDPGEETSAAEPTTAPTPSKLSSGSAVAGGVATNPRRARRRVRRVAPRLRPA